MVLHLNIPKIYTNIILITSQNTLDKKRNDDDLRAAVTDWLDTQAADFYEEGISKLIHRYDKCLNLFGDYVEK